jgi:2-keto-4-pentenoate hydratase/2-oxohepta-3-ene-1,7-dioic acid hydratase in catechol pathway
MTLAPGDVILTGAPEGVVDVQPGEKSSRKSTASAAREHRVGDTAFGR